MNESDSMGYTYTETIFSVYLSSDLTGHFVFLFANLATLLTPQCASGTQDSWPGPRRPHKEAVRPHLAKIIPPPASASFHPHWLVLVGCVQNMLSCHTYVPTYEESITS